MQQAGRQQRQRWRALTASSTTGALFREPSACEMRCPSSANTILPPCCPQPCAQRPSEAGALSACYCWRLAGPALLGSSVYASCFVLGCASGLAAAWPRERVIVAEL